MHGVDGGAVGRRERDVRLVVRGPAAGLSQKCGMPSGPAMPHDGPGEAHRLAHAERREQAQVRRGGGVDVGGLEAEVVDHMADHGIPCCP